MEFLRAGDPWNPNSSIFGSGGEQFVDARPTEEWTKVRSRRTYLNRNILERHSRTLHCLGCKGCGPHSDECRERIEGMMIDTDEAFDTRAGKRVHDPDESKEGEKAKPCSKKSRTEKCRASEDLKARGFDVNNMLCEKPSIDLTHDEMALSGQIPTRRAEKGTAAGT